MARRRAALSSIGLVVAPHKRRAAKLARECIDTLHALGVVAKADPEMVRLLGGAVFPAQLEELAQTDLVLVLGGDGTLLRTAAVAAPFGTPLLGVYLGGFGFLTETTAALLPSQLPAISAGQFAVEERMMLGAAFSSAGGPEGDGPLLAINDVAVHRGLAGGQLECRVAVDGVEVGCYKGDGLVVATPTGSTAYSLACGGPVVHPEVECIILTPTSLHTLNIRPLVVSPERSIEVRPVGGHQALRSGASVTADGRSLGVLTSGSSLTVRRSPYCARFCTLGQGTFIDRLRRKLKWGAEI